MITRMDERLEGIEFRMEAPEFVNLDDDVNLAFSIRNGKMRPIVYAGIPIEGFRRKPPYFRMSLVDAEGKPVPRTPGVGMKLVRFPPPGNWGDYIQLTIGESRRWNVELSEFFEVSRGSYFLTVEIWAYDSEQNPRFRGRRDDAGRPIDLPSRGEVTAVGRFEDIPITIH